MLRITADSCSWLQMQCNGGSSIKCRLAMLQGLYWLSAMGKAKGEWSRPWRLESANQSRDRSDYDE